MNEINSKKHSSRVSTFLPVHTVNCVQTLKACGFKVELARACCGVEPGVRLPEERSYVWRLWTPGQTSDGGGGEDRGTLHHKGGAVTAEPLGSAGLFPGRKVCLVGASHSYYLNDYFANLLPEPQTQHIEAKYPREFADMLRTCRWGRSRASGTTSSPSSALTPDPSSLSICADLDRCQVYVLGLTQWPSAFTSVLPYSERFNGNKWWSRDINRQHPITASEIEADFAQLIALLAPGDPCPHDHGHPEAGHNVTAVFVRGTHPNPPRLKTAPPPPPPFLFTENLLEDSEGLLCLGSTVSALT
jgi:hypothetical protein